VYRTVSSIVFREAPPEAGMHSLFFACVYQFSASWVTFEIMCVVSSELAREIEHHRLAHWLARLCVMSHVFVSLLAVVFA
jgi:hypothetical protein